MDPSYPASSVGGYAPAPTSIPPSNGYGAPSGAVAPSTSSPSSSRPGTAIQPTTSAAYVQQQNSNGFTNGYYAPQTNYPPRAPPPQYQQTQYPPHIQNQPLQHATYSNYPQQQYSSPALQAQHPYQHQHPSISPITPHSAASSSYPYPYSPHVSQSLGVAPVGVSSYSKPLTGPNTTGGPNQGSHPQFQRTMSISSTSSHGNASVLSTPTLAPSSSTSVSAGLNGSGELVSPASGSTSGMSEPLVRTPATDPGLPSASGPSTYSSVHVGGMGNMVQNSHRGFNGGGYAPSNPAMPVSSPHAPMGYHSDVDHGTPGPYNQVQLGPGYPHTQQGQAQGFGYPQPTGSVMPPPPLQEQFTGKTIMTPEDLHEYRRMLSAAQRNDQNHPFHPNMPAAGGPPDSGYGGGAAAFGVGQPPSVSEGSRSRSASQTSGMMPIGTNSTGTQSPISRTGTSASYQSQPYNVPPHALGSSQPYMSSHPQRPQQHPLPQNFQQFQRPHPHAPHAFTQPHQPGPNDLSYWPTSGSAPPSSISDHKVYLPTPNNPPPGLFPASGGFGANSNGGTQFAGSPPFGSQSQSGVPSTAVGVGLTSSNQHQHQAPHLPNSIRTRKPERPRLLIEQPFSPPSTSSGTIEPEEAATTSGAAAAGVSESKDTSSMKVNAGEANSSPSLVSSANQSGDAIRSATEAAGESLSETSSTRVIYDSLHGFSLLANDLALESANPTSTATNSDRLTSTAVTANLPSTQNASHTEIAGQATRAASTGTADVGQPAVQTSSNTMPTKTPSENSALAMSDYSNRLAQNQNEAPTSSPVNTALPSSQPHSPVVSISRTSSRSRIGPPPLNVDGSSSAGLTFLEAREMQQHQQLQYQQQLMQHHGLQWQQHAAHVAGVQQNPQAEMAVRQQQALAGTFHSQPASSQFPDTRQPLLIRHPGPTGAQHYTAQPRGGPGPQPPHAIPNTTMNNPPPSQFAGSTHPQQGYFPPSHPPPGQQWQQMPPQRLGWHPDERPARQYPPPNVGQPQAPQQGLYGPYAPTPPLHYGAQQQHLVYGNYPPQFQTTQAGYPVYDPSTQAFSSSTDPSDPAILASLPSNQPLMPPQPLLSSSSSSSSYTLSGSVTTATSSTPNTPAYRAPRSPMLGSRTPFFVRPPTPEPMLPGQPKIERFHPPHPDSLVGGELRYVGFEIREAYALSEVPITRTHKFADERGAKGAARAAAVAAANPASNFVSTNANGGAPGNKKRKAPSSSSRRSGRRTTNARKPKMLDDSDEDVVEGSVEGASNEPPTPKAPRPRRKASEKIFNATLIPPDDEDDDEYFSEKEESDKSDSDDDYVEDAPARPAKKKGRRATHSGDEEEQAEADAARNLASEVEPAASSSQQSKLAKGARLARSPNSRRESTITSGGRSSRR